MFGKSMLASMVHVLKSRGSCYTKEKSDSIATNGRFKLWKKRGNIVLKITHSEQKYADFIGN